MAKKGIFLESLGLNSCRKIIIDGMPGMCGQEDFVTKMNFYAFGGIFIDRFKMYLKNL